MHQRRSRSRTRRHPPKARVTRRKKKPARAYKVVPLIVRFLAKITLPLNEFGIPVIDTDRCWEWNAYIGKNNGYGVGYGQIRGEPDPETGGRGRLLKAHVASYLLFNGEIPYKWDVCHACDNTTCVNPQHLFAAPHKANMHDYIVKYGGLGRPKSPISVDQLKLFREEGHEPFIGEGSEDALDEGYSGGASAGAEEDCALEESEVPF